MQEIEKLLHIPFEEQKYAQEDALPIFIRRAYGLKILIVEGDRFLFA